jgi:hypothetical protein
MAGTRHTRNSGPPEMTTNLTSRGEGGNSDTICVERPRPQKMSPTFTLASTALSTAPSSTGGMEDLSLTSPSISNLPCTPRRTRTEIPDADPDRTLSSALRRLRSMPGTTGKGSAYNPIDLEEYSPRRNPVPVPPRKHKSRQPNMFGEQHRKGFAYLPPRAALAPMPANGRVFTGHKEYDIYRMMNAKAAAEGWTVPPPPAPHTPVPVSHAYAPSAYGQSEYGVPFEVQYPMSAQCFPLQAQHPQHDPNIVYQSPYAQYHTYTGVSLAGDSEDTLRNKALQLVREHSRPKPHAKLLSSDPDETSASETDTNTSQRLRKRKLPVFRDTDLIAPLAAQTSLLTSLLQIYPKSTDQRGLRADIALLVSVQNERVAEWMGQEVREARKRRRSGTDSGISVSGEGIEMVRAREAVADLLERERMEREKEKERDDQVRGLLSAGAGMWQDGSGEGVVDVFACGEGRQIAEVVVRPMVERHGGLRCKGVCGWVMA